MGIASQIRATRLERSRSIETTETHAGVQKGLLRLENGDQVPSMENLQRLAVALGVPVYRFFFADGERVSTPFLTPRLSLDDLATLDALSPDGGQPQ